MVVWQLTKGNQRIGEIYSGKKTKESNKAIHHHPKCEAKCEFTVRKIKTVKKKKKPNNDIGDQKHIKDQMIKFMAKEINKSSGTCFRGYAGNAWSY